MTWAEVWNWIQSHWGYIILGIIVFYFTARHKVIAWIRKKRGIVEEEEVFPIQEPVLGQPYDLMSSMNEQKKATEQELRTLNVDGKNLVKAEKEMEQQYRKQKMLFYHQKRNLSLRYSTCKSRLYGITELIENQRKMDLELNPVKPKEKRKRK